MAVVPCSALLSRVFVATLTNTTAPVNEVLKRVGECMGERHEKRQQQPCPGSDCGDGEKQKHEE